MLTRLKGLVGPRQDHGFTLIELLIVILIVGILAAVATPLYLGYVKDAKTAEAKGVAGSLWTAVQGNAIVSCGQDTDVTSGYARAGFTATGDTTPVRWKVVNGITNLRVACADGSISPDGTVFEIDGTASDVSFVKVQLVYSAGATPPSKLRCDTGSGTFTDC
jgi:type IV pilus assembly protein PilA